MDGIELAARIDHTLLRPGATDEDLERHCREAIDLGFRSVCVHPARLARAGAILAGSGVRLCGVVAFPHGGATLLSKVFEALECWKAGATEVDVVLDLSAIASGDRGRIDLEVRTIMDKTSECAHKFIVETGLFTERQLEPVLGVMNQRRPAFVKSSTGVNGPGASVEAVAFLRSRLHRSIQVKAAGGIRTLEQAAALLDAGASCLGTSAGADLVRRAAGPFR